jgi:murein DD-endopeptidase MepM/ murein hydrolase activator NlpD
MRSLPRPAVWPQLVAISLMGLGAAGCSADSARFGDWFGSTNSSMSRGDASAVSSQTASAGHIESKPLPHLAGADDGSSGAGRGTGSYQGSYQPASGSAPSAATQTSAASARQTHTAAVHPTSSPTAPRGALVAPSVVHVVAARQTLNSIARIYHKPVTLIARANNLSVNAKVKAGDRITIPEIKEASQPAPTRAEAAASPPTGTLAMAESPQTVRIAEPAGSTAQDNAVKTAEPAGSLPGFRWPVRGRVIGAFGPKPNGVQNDGINLAVPEGTPIKASEDGVVAYAGSELKGYGNLVLVRHPNGFVTAYAHASDILVKRGEAVKRGQVIAHAGQTGNVTSPQLHFEIRKGATPVDPSQYLSGA